MKNILLILLFAAMLPSCVERENYNNTYKVKITFCDTRPPDTILIVQSYPPKNNQIYTYKRAVPEWKNYLNVCDLKVLSSSLDSL